MVISISTLNNNLENQIVSLVFILIFSNTKIYRNNKMVYFHKCSAVRLKLNEKDRHYLVDKKN